MLACNGYKMFHGTIKIILEKTEEVFEVSGTWVYVPDKGVWYCQSDDGHWLSGWSKEDVVEFREDV